MRLRHIKGAEEEIAESPYVVQDPQSLKGRWHEFFGNDNPIRIEVGMGKGKFIMELAQMNPDINYVGIERYSSILLRGLQKRAELELSNIYFMRIDALELTEVFADNEDTTFDAVDSPVITGYVADKQTVAAVTGIGAKDADTTVNVVYNKMGQWVPSYPVGTPDVPTDPITYPNDPDNPGDPLEPGEGTPDAVSLPGYSVGKP